MSGEVSQGMQVSAEAERIFDNTMQTRYQYPPYVINDETGTYYVDCSGFVGHVLENIAPEHYKLIPASDQFGPQAFEYFLYFDSPPTSGSVGWSRICRLVDCLPGDIIAWRLLESVGDTGHVFIVADVPAVLKSGHIAVRACDSSDILHYDDSRDLGDGGQTTGVGTGTIHFEVDPTTGSPTAFQFGPGDAFHSLPIAIGPLEPIAPAG